MQVFEFGFKKVGYGFADNSDGEQFIALCNLDFPDQERGITEDDVLLKFPNRESYLDWISNLIELAPAFKE